MEQKKGKFGLRLNLFDCIVILAAVVVAALLLWSRMRPEDTAAAAVPAASEFQYTIVLQKTVEGTGAMVKESDALVDTVKNYDMGTVVSVETVPATKSILDHGNAAYVTAEIPGYEDVYIVVKSTATASEEQVVLGSGYVVRVGESVYVRGPGYLGSGEVYAMERGE